MMSVHNSSTGANKELYDTNELKSSNAASKSEYRNNAPSDSGSEPTGCFDNIPTIPTK